MNSLEISESLILQFRDLVNSNNDYVLFHYRNVKGKNKWNCICSCMDWISVAVRYLSNGIKFDENIDIRVMQLFSYISAVNIVVDSIIQLHRVFFDTDEVPFKGDKKIFVDNDFNLDDYDYFKEIRAIFGAHPVNLKSKKNLDDKRYASWPFKPFSSQNAFFEVRLYSNRAGVEDINMSINILKVNEYLLRMYGYLDTIGGEIKKQYKDYCDQLSLQVFQKGKDPLERLRILEKESKKRLDTNYYKYIINDLIRIFETNTGMDSIAIEEEQFKTELINVIDELEANIQSMRFEELKTDEIINPKYNFNKLGYSISKLFTYEFSEKLEPLYKYHMKTLDEYSNSNYDFINTTKPAVLFLKLKMMLYRYSKSE
jgi:hypothetical protein